MSEQPHVIVSTNTFLEQHHHAMAELLAALPNVRFSAASKRFCDNSPTRLVPIEQKIWLDDWKAVDKAVSAADLVHCTVDSLSVLNVAKAAQRIGKPSIVSFLGGYDISVKLDKLGAETGLAGVLARATAVTVTAHSHCAVISERYSVMPVHLPVPIWPQVLCDDLPEGCSDLGNYVVSCGRFIQRKGIQHAIAALLQLPSQLSLVVIGNGPLDGYLRHMADQLGLEKRVRFLGALPLAKTLGVLSRAEALVHLACVGDEGDLEGVPQIILWAQFLGIPVITTASGAIPDIVADGKTGILTLCEPNSVAQAFATARENCLDLTRNAQTHVRDEHGIAKIARDLRALYDKALKGAQLELHDPPDDYPPELIAAIEQLSDRIEIVAVRSSRNHIIAEIRSALHGHCALKVRRPTAPSGTAAAHLLWEIDVLNRIKPECGWAPRLFDYDPNRNWLLRSWVEGRVLDSLSSGEVSHEMITSFCSFSKRVFEQFHNDPIGIVIKDFKPANIIACGGSFTLIDFDSVNKTATLSARHEGTGLGTAKYRYVAPEILFGGRGVDHRADYFSFGTCVFRMIMGFLPWTNTRSQVVESERQYVAEYQLVRDVYSHRLLALGFSEDLTFFLVGCLNPMIEERPGSFPSSRETYAQIAVTL